MPSILDGLLSRRGRKSVHETQLNSVWGDVQITSPTERAPEHKESQVNIYEIEHHLRSINNESSPTAIHLISSNTSAKAVTQRPHFLTENERQYSPPNLLFLPSPKQTPTQSPSYSLPQPRPEPCSRPLGPQEALEKALVEKGYYANALAIYGMSPGLDEYHSPLLSKDFSSDHSEVNSPGTELDVSHTVNRRRLEAVEVAALARRPKWVERPPQEKSHTIVHASCTSQNNAIEKVFSSPGISLLSPVSETFEKGTDEAEKKHGTTTMSLALTESQHNNVYGTQPSPHSMSSTLLPSRLNSPNQSDLTQGRAQSPAMSESSRMRSPPLGVTEVMRIKSPPLGSTAWMRVHHVDADRAMSHSRGTSFDVVKNTRCASISRKEIVMPRRQRSSSLEPPASPAFFRISTPYALDSLPDNKLPLPLQTQREPSSMGSSEVAQPQPTDAFHRFDHKKTNSQQPFTTADQAALLKRSRSQLALRSPDFCKRQAFRDSPPLDPGSTSDIQTGKGFYNQVRDDYSLLQRDVLAANPITRTQHRFRSQSKQPSRARSATRGSDQRTSESSKHEGTRTTHQTHLVPSYDEIWS